jgi:hypothetical protein
MLEAIQLKNTGFESIFTKRILLKGINAAVQEQTWKKIIQLKK